MEALKPLAGVRMVDFCWVLAGPLGTRLLSNFGAEVIRIESRIRPDNMRRMAVAGADPNVAGLFNGANTGKRSVTVDLSTERGVELVKRLIDTADVVTNNYRAGALRNMGFRYEELSQTNPGLISVSLPGAGHKGPWSPIGTLGNLLQGASGMNSVTGFPGRPLRGVGVAYPDFTSPYILAILVCAALRERQRTGVGKEIILSQLSATISLIGVEWMQYASSGIEPGQRSNRDPNFCPHGVYRSSGDDEWVAIAVRGDEQWSAFCDTIGRPELESDERFASHDARKANEDALDDFVSEWTSARDRWTAADRLQEAGVPAAAVENVRDALERDGDRHHFEHVSQPSNPDIDILVDAEAIRFVGVDRPLRRVSMLGEDNEDVFRNIVGLSNEEYDELVATGVIN